MGAVSTRLDLVLADHPARSQPRRVRSTWSYTSDQPFTVRAVFHVDDADVTWVFARDLLIDGLMADSGEGDVRIRPLSGGRDQIAVDLRSPSGHVTLLADREPVVHFAQESLQLVPMGDETSHLDLDRWIVQMLR